MLALKLNEILYPVKWQLPPAGDRHAVEVYDPETRKKIAALSWDAYTHEIRNIRVGFTRGQERQYQRRGIATALLRLARTREAVRHSATRSDDGEAWARSLGERLPKRALAA